MYKYRLQLPAAGQYDDTPSASVPVFSDSSNSLIPLQVSAKITFLIVMGVMMGLVTALSASVTTIGHRC